MPASPNDTQREEQRRALYSVTTRFEKSPSVLLFPAMQDTESPKPQWEARDPESGRPTGRVYEGDLGSALEEAELMSDKEGHAAAMLRGEEARLAFVHEDGVVSAYSDDPGSIRPVVYKKDSGTALFKNDKGEVETAPVMKNGRLTAGTGENVRPLEGDYSPYARALTEERVREGRKEMKAAAIALSAHPTNRRESAAYEKEAGKALEGREDVFGKDATATLQVANGWKPQDQKWIVGIPSGKGNEQMQFGGKIEAPLTEALKEAEAQHGAPAEASIRGKSVRLIAAGNKLEAGVQVENLTLFKSREDGQTYVGPSKEGKEAGNVSFANGMPKSHGDIEEVPRGVDDLTWNMVDDAARLLEKINPHGEQDPAPKISKERQNQIARIAHRESREGSTSGPNPSEKVGRSLG